MDLANQLITIACNSLCCALYGFLCYRVGYHMAAKEPSDHSTRSTAK